jgi:hypothetical protein
MRRMILLVGLVVVASLVRGQTVEAHGLLFVLLYTLT